MNVITCPRTIICNTCENINVYSDIFNSGGNVEDQEDCGFYASFFKISPFVIDDITKKIDEDATDKFEIPDR